jgi:hypothetical protein
MRYFAHSADVPPKSLANEQQQQLLERFWVAQRENAHRLLVERSRFTNTLDNFEWRVDVKAAAMGKILCVYAVCALKPFV